MEEKNQIRYVKRKEIEDDLWNNCIDNATNGLVYSYSHYLDNMANDWDALVLNDYETVMPLPFRKKFGVYYLYQPFLTAQLGVFGAQLNKEIFTSFLEAIPKKFRYWDLSFNHKNLFSNSSFPLYERSNFILSLQPTYENIYNAYRENIQRNIKKSEGFRNKIETGISIDAIIELTRLQAKEINENDFENFKKVFLDLKSKGFAKTYGVISKSGQLISSAAFIFSHNRAYYILVGNHPNGRTLGASHALIDAFIKDHADQNLLLDFEGSDIRNLAFFYSSFGAAEEKYASIKLNRLPWWTRWLK